jgi:hypothetical protein
VVARAPLDRRERDRLIHRAKTLPVGPLDEHLT